jgi:hypothetical protein
MDIEDLNLIEPALTGAKLLRHAHPAVVFTSGRRKVEDQARAMAQNVARNRQWIVQTYVATAQRDQLQGWVNAHASATTVAAIQAGLQAIMQAWTPVQRGKLSKHFSGLAFDVQPMPAGSAADAVKAAIRALPRLDKFLEMEGGLVRWHAQFLPPT